MPATIGNLAHATAIRPFSIVAFRTSPSRPHFPGAPGWQQSTDCALAWAIANAKPNGPLTEPARFPHQHERNTA